MAPVAKRKRCGYQLGANLDGTQLATAERADHQFVQQEAQVGLASAAVDDLRIGVTSIDIVERWAQQAHEVTDLLELAAGVLIELTIAGEQVQLLQERERHPLGNVGISERIRCGAAAGGFHRGTVAASGERLLGPRRSLGFAATGNPRSGTELQSVSAASLPPPARAVEDRPDEPADEDHRE
jgi:hypothetical protein